MAGPFHADFSRFERRSNERYSGVFQQQGRVQLDSDWNALVDSLRHQFRTGFSDMLGAAATPAGSAGFSLRPQATLRFTGAQQLLVDPDLCRQLTGCNELSLEIELVADGAGAAGTLLAVFDAGQADSAPLRLFSIELDDDGVATLRLANEAEVDAGHSVHGQQRVWVGFRWNQTSLSLLVNGSVVTSSTCPHLPGATQLTLIVGARSLAGEHGMSADLHQVRLSASHHDAPLSAAWTANQPLAQGAQAFDGLRDAASTQWRLIPGSGTGCPRHLLADLMVTPGRLWLQGMLVDNSNAYSLSERNRQFRQLLAAPITDETQAVLLYVAAWEDLVTGVDDPELVESALETQDNAARSVVAFEVYAVALPAPPTGDVSAWLRRRVEREPGPALTIRQTHDHRGIDDNGLYRIEAHAVGAAQPIVIKWSRDNGSCTAPLADVLRGADTLTCTGLPPDGFACGSRLEITARASADAAPVGEITQVRDIDGHTIQLLAPLAHDYQGSAKARLWDGVEEVANDDDASAWFSIDGLFDARIDHVQQARPGDFWTIPIRTAPPHFGTWLAAGAQTSAPRSRDGTHHAHAPLAVLRRWPDGGFQIDDLRQQFQPAAAGYVSKQGDVVDGPLRIKPHAQVARALDVDGRARFHEVEGRLVTPGAVGTLTLQDHSVTPAKLAPDIGIVPPGFSILSETAAAPPGYRYSGCAFYMRNDTPEWVRIATVVFTEQPADLHAVGSGDLVHLMFSSGTMVRLDRITGAVTTCEAAPASRTRRAVAANADYVWCAGGLDTSGQRSSDVFEYDITRDTWTRLPDLRIARSDFALIAHGSTLHAVGGLRDRWGIEMPTRSVETLVDSRWRAGTNLPRPLARHAGASTDHGVTIAGGVQRALWWFGPDVGNRATLRLASPSSRSWERQRELAYPTADATLIAAGDRTFLLGGNTGGRLRDDVFEYGGTADHWSFFSKLPQSVAGRPESMRRLDTSAAVGGNLLTFAVSTPANGETVIDVHSCLAVPRMFVHTRLNTPASDLEVRIDQANRGKPDQGARDDG